MKPLSRSFQERKDRSLPSCDARQSKFPYSVSLPLFTSLSFFSKKMVGERFAGSRTSIYLPSFRCFHSLAFPSCRFTTMSLRRLHDKSNCSDASSARRGSRMCLDCCCPAVSTGSQRSLMIGRLPRNCGLSRTPLLPDRSILSIGLPCVPSRLRCDRTGLVRAASKVIICVNNRRDLMIRFSRSRWNVFKQQNDIPIFDSESIIVLDYGQFYSYCYHKIYFILLFLRTVKSTYRINFALVIPDVYVIV